MPRVRLSEFRAKTIVNNYFETPYSGISLDTSSEDTSVIDKSLKPDKRYVVKVDQGIKKRFKQGLVKLDLSTSQDIKNAISEIQNKGFSNFIIEELVSHERGEERYLALERTSLGTVCYYSKKGGVDIESHESEVRNELIRDPEDAKKIASELGLNPDFLTKLLEVVDINYFSFLEINPLVITFKTPLMLDIAVEVDSAAEFFVDTWGSKDLREGRRDQTQEEKNVSKLSEKSQASFKLVVLNPQGSIFMLLSGGGASIVLADEVHNLGSGQELANYGEYSGNPNEEETFIYTKNVLNLMLSSKSSNKVLIIGGGVANFTDVRITFRGIIRALSEARDELVKQKIRIYVRRGGPQQEEGLALIRSFMNENKIEGEVHGPDIVLTDIVSKALNK
ncbi:MAG: hypothetical protein A2776_01795 [Candidatus Levybacteria bacterium RIFCSPHIGHO2_01_FULL_40_10]|nr:MAG: hypothetical protein A2776_01795 [Candidatus Levybacteria bacterium RIFCSPHIGHO2_01_FULL_40_10]